MGVGRTQQFSRAADNSGMRILLILGLLAGGCTKANPNSCCTTAEQCSAVGLKDVTACKSGNVCDPYGACVKPQCAASTDCTSPDAPICLGGLCVAKCTADADCNGIASMPYCASDGECVACKDDMACSGDTPICDAIERQCRACSLDSECASGVCLEEQGACADSSRIVYIETSGVDNGTCEESTPCASFAWALPQTSTQRNVIRVRGVSLDVGPSTVSLSMRTLFIDGEDTVVTRSAGGPVFTVGSGAVTFEGLTIGTPGGTNQSVSVTGGTVDLYDVRMLAPAAFTGGTTSIEASTTASRIDCSNGAMFSLVGNIVHGPVVAQGCAATLQRNRIIDTGAGCFVDGASSLVENNVFIARNSFSDGLTIANGATARFNTLANLSGVDSGAISLSCNGTVKATSNIIAWHSSHAPCASQYSLFDEIAGNQPGTGNVSGNAASFFVDLAGGDLLLAAGSPALGAADPTIQVTTDFDGNSRPNPSGTTPDIGAYEAP